MPGSVLRSSALAQRQVTRWAITRLSLSQGLNHLAGDNTAGPIGTDGAGLGSIPGEEYTAVAVGPSGCNRYSAAALPQAEGRQMA